MHTVDYVRAGLSDLGRPDGYLQRQLAGWVDRWNAAHTPGCVDAARLVAIGAKLAATKYNGFASISNTPIWYMGLLLAAAQTQFGARGMLATESVFGVVGILVFVAATRVWRPAAAASLAPAT